MINYQEIMSHLKRLCMDKNTGTLFITTDKNHSVRFDLHNGNIVSCNYRSKQDDAAIALIKTIKAGKYKFYPKTSLGAPTSESSESTNFYEKLFPGSSAEGADFSQASDSSQTVFNKQMKPAIQIIEKELANFIGPVADLICGEYLNTKGQVANFDDLLVMIETGAKEIDNPGQEKQYKEQVLAKIK